MSLRLGTQEIAPIIEVGGESATGIPRIDMTATTATLDPNKFYVWGEVSSLDISLAAETAGIENVYKFQFQSGAIATTLTLPSNVSIDGEYPNAIKTTYIVSIESNIAKIERKRKESLLPTTYQQVEYLKSNGTQLINTEVVGAGSLTMVVDLQADVNNTWSFGARVNWHGNQKFVFANYDDQSSWEKLYTAYGINYNVDAHALANDGQRHIYTVDRGQFLIDSTIIKSYSQQNFSTVGELRLFAYYDRDSNRNLIMSTCSIYQCTISDNGVTIANLYPCYRKADNVAGMYDIVRDRFLTNAGSGIFIVGPDV